MHPPRAPGWLSLALVLLLALPAQAARLALVIGNDTYQKVVPLKNARNDARLMAGILKKAGFDVTPASDLSRDGLWGTIDTFKGRIQKGDEVVFYFAGHGVQIGANQLLLPVDIAALNDAQVQRDGVPLLEVQDALKDARVAVLLLDACRDNPFPKTGTRTIGGTRGLSPPEPSTGQIIMMSAGRNQKALDYVPGQQQGNGLFTWELGQALQTPGIEIRAALEQVKERVDDKARRAGHEQRPSLVNDLRGNFYLSGGKAADRAEQFASLSPEPSGRLPQSDPEEDAWAATKAANTVAAFDAYLAEYPSGRYAGAARIGKVAAQGQSGAQPVITQTAQQRLASTSTLSPGQVIKDCADCPEMVVIPSGTFTMGSSAQEQAQANAAGLNKTFTDRENPQHNVSISSFAMGKTEVTRGQFAAFVAASGHNAGNSCYTFTDFKWADTPDRNWRNPGFAQTDTDPVACVNWDDAQAYVRWLSQKSGKTYRLPSEAEWEYACRAGANQTYCGSDNVDNVAVYGRKNGAKTLPVAGKQANALGLHDMSGNVWEWTQDWHHDNYSGAPADGRAWESGGEQVYRVLRGGSWNDSPTGLRAAYRLKNSPGDHYGVIGFRLAKTSP